jgi:hypothetical protein
MKEKRGRKIKLPKRYEFFKKINDKNTTKEKEKPHYKKKRKK